MTVLYDPPGGWRHGFPRAYRPKDGETLAETLIRDGYPEKELMLDHAGRAKYVRFIGEWNHEPDSPCSEEPEPASTETKGQEEV